MGNEQSSAFAGYRVLSVLPNSPGVAANLDTYFDFIVEAAGVRLDTLERPFTDIISKHVGKPLKLKVFNCMTHAEREVDLTPRNDWGGSGLLGITIRFDNYEQASSEVVHVLNVEKNSPGEKAGLRPSSDYMLGTSDIVFHDENELAETCAAFVGQSMQVYVYNSDDERVRIVTLTPSYEWGGEGLLGCDIGSGYLHQLPDRRENSEMTVSEGALAALPSRRVRSSMGKGVVESIRPDGFMSVKLDWTLANERSAQLIVKEQHLRFLVDQTPLPPIVESGGAPAAGGSAGDGKSGGGAQDTTADELPEEAPLSNEVGEQGDDKVGNKSGATVSMDLDLS
jgi:hypothetical protein